MESNHQGRKGWGLKKKIEVVTTYLALGTAPMTEAVTGVPAITIRMWKMQPWWKELECEIRSEETTQLDNKLSKIIDRSLDTVVDRIENGDFLLDSRTGSIRRVPVKMKDVHKVSVDLIDKRDLIRKKETVLTDKTTVDDVIKKLADQFKDFVKYQSATQIEGTKLIEGESVAIHEERQEGLQEGESDVQLTPRDGEEAGGTQPSSQGCGESREGTQG